MDKQLAKLFLPLVNHNNQELAEYAKYRIEILHRQLEAEKEVEKIYQIQGKIAELRRLFTLRDEVILAAKGE